MEVTIELINSILSDESALPKGYTIEYFQETSAKSSQFTNTGYRIKFKGEVVLSKAMRWGRIEIAKKHSDYIKKEKPYLFGLLIRDLIINGIMNNHDRVKEFNKNKESVLEKNP